MDLETLRRTLIQRLESDRRFGISHVAPSNGTFDLSFLRDVDETTDGPAVLPPAKTPAAATTIVTTLATSIPTGGKITPPNLEPSTAPRSERVSQLTVLANRVTGCTRCEELASTRQQTVFGTGNVQAAIFFLGEAPGADEDRTGVPFVGKAGQLLDRIVTACGLTRDDIYIGNILKCRPPGNRNPSPREATNCFEYLSAQIAIVDPDYIVCWGKVAAENLLGLKEPVGKLRKRLFPYGRAKVAVTYHPSYLLRNPAAKKDVWEDMKWLFRDMGVDLDAARKK